MSIISESNELEMIAKKKCEEQGLDIEATFEMKLDPTELHKIWTEAQKEFYKEEVVELDEYKVEKQSQNNKIKRIENLLEMKKIDFDMEKRESTRGIIIGLEMALTIFR